MAIVECFPGGNPPHPGIASNLELYRVELLRRTREPDGPAMHYFNTANTAQVLQDILDFGTKGAERNPKELFVSEQIPSGAGLIVDGGCSTGRNFLAWIRRDHRCLGVDLDPVALHVGQILWKRRGGPMPCLAIGDALNLPVAGDSCSGVVSVVTMGGLPFRRAVREAQRVLAPGGRFIFCLEAEGFWRNRWDLCGTDLKQRLRVLRWRMAAMSLDRGFDWQRSRLMWRIAGYPQLSERFVRLVLAESGFDVVTLETLSTYRDQPRIRGWVAEKRGIEPA